MYLLHIYGGKHIEESKEKFETEEEAIEEAEMRCTDDNEGWEEKSDGSKVLVDYNNSDNKEDIVISKVKEV
jgi:hypothetical protein